MSDFSNNSLPSDNDSIQRSFATAMMNSFVSNLVFKGIQSPPNHGIDFFDISLATIESGVSQLSYRAAIETIAHYNEEFKKIKEDPKNKYQTIVYMAGSSLGALYATGINYPIECIREFRNSDNENKKINMNLKDAKSFYVDKVFGYFGFATSMKKLSPLFPKFKNNNVHNYFLIQMSRLNSLLTIYPYKMLKQNSVEFVPYMKNSIQSLAIKAISSDLSTQFQKEIGRIQFI